MKSALVLEKDSASCNSTSSLLASLGYMVTPVFRPEKALHVARLLHFDLIVIHTTAIPEDRRSLAGELKRCDPSSVLVLLIEPGSAPCDKGQADCGNVDMVLHRPLTPQALQRLPESRPQDDDYRPPAPPRVHERRQSSLM